MNRVLVIHTGGTISMVKDAQNHTVNLGSENKLAKAASVLNHAAEITEIEAFHKPSPHMTVEDMIALKHLIETEYEKQHFQGVVITHGTDTLEETAFFLDMTVQVDIPVIITGAMRSSNETGSDGLYNFLCAIRTALLPETNGKGVLVVFNDEIHTAVEVTKTHTTNVSAFESILSGPVGSITNQMIHYNYHPIPQNKINVSSISKRTALIKAYAGMDSSMFHFLKQAKYDGVVIEALGQGNLPPGVLDGLNALLEAHIPVVLVSRCLKGFVYPSYNYLGGGKQLEDLGIIFCEGLTGQKARLKLLAALMNNNSIKEIKKVFS